MTIGIKYGKIFNINKLWIEGGLIDIEHYIKNYYGGEKPKNINVYFLNPEEYDKKYKELTKKIFGRTGNGYESTCGHCIYDKKNDFYYVLLKNYGGDCFNAYALNLFHELAHTETMPQKIGASLFCSSKKKDDNAIVGYEFWKEYIAQYFAVNKFQVLVGKIAFLYDKEAASRVLKNLLKNYNQSLYEIVLYSEITGIYIEGAEEETKELISELKKVKSGFTSKEEIRNITKKELNLIGKKVINLLQNIEEREKDER